MERKICAFTGHRYISSEHKAGLSELLLRAINYAYDRGCTDFYAGGALGFDTAAAKEVIRFRMQHRDVRLVILVPWLGQSEKWSPAQRDTYDYILSVADEVVYIAQDYYDGCIRERNMRLVENAEMVIAYVHRSYSGAAQTVRMAKSRGIDVYNLYYKLDEK